MRVEAKKIDQLAKREIEKTCYASEKNLHMFTIGFKQFYRMTTGNELRYMCTTKCTESTCTCEIPPLPTIK